MGEKCKKLIFTKYFVVYIETPNSYYILLIRQIITLIFQLYGVNLKKILAHESGILYSFAIFGHDAKKNVKNAAYHLIWPSAAPSTHPQGTTHHTLHHAQRSPQG